MPGIVLVNPAVFNDKRDAMAVVVNEALRLFMEDSGFKPNFEVTPEQRSLFKGTAYADDEDALRKTVTARVATFDTSVKPTSEQVSETRRLIGLVMEAIGEQHQDFPLMQKIDELLSANKDMNSVSVQMRAQSEGTAQDDMLGGDVYGYKIRKPAAEEDEYFKGNTNVAGMATEDGMITLNPYSKNTPEQQAAVAKNEAARLYMESIDFAAPNVTAAQRRAFAGTEYGKPENEKFLRHTIIGRIISNDASAGETTPEQRSAAEKVLKALKSRGSTKDDMLGGDVSMSPSVAGLVFANSPIVPEAESVSINETPTRSPMETTVSKVIAALEQVESGGNPNLVGDRGRAVGILQTWPIMVDEANRIAGREIWKDEDRKNPQLSRAMAKVFLEHHYKKGVTDPIELGKLWRNPTPAKKPAPAWYAKKVKRELESQAQK